MSGERSRQRRRAFLRAGLAAIDLEETAERATTAFRRFSISASRMIEVGELGAVAQVHRLGLLRRRSKAGRRLVRLQRRRLQRATATRRHR